MNDMTTPMDEAAEALPPSDHNNPPVKLITGKELDDYLTITYAELRQRADAVVARGKDFIRITNERELEDATEYMVKCRAIWKALEAARVAEKQPYDDAAGMVHAHFKRPLDELGLAPTAKGRFDPVEHDEFGIGPRVTMAMTIYSANKVERERLAREAEAARLRKIEDDARREREAAAKAARDAEDKRRREAAEAERIAEEERRQLELAASRKRNEESKAAAETAAAEARARAHALRQAREAEERAIEEARAAREQADREEENRLAEQRAAAEASAAVSSADLSRTRGYRGGVSSLREFLDTRDICRETIDLEKLRPYFTDKAIEQAIRAFLDGNKASVGAGVKSGVQPLRGVTFFYQLKSASRA